MTRISGYNIIGCPHCEAPYITPSYSSVNFIALESWTDGYRTHSLMPPSESMRLCTACNEMYAISEVKPLGYLSRDEIDEVVLNPVPLAKAWLARLGRRLFGGPKPICWLPDEQVADRLSRLLLVDALRQLGEFDFAREALSSENTERGWGWYQKMLIDPRMGHVGLYPD
jgi:hypothetical protein